MNSLRCLLLIAKYTFVELYKSRILFNVVLLGIALLFIGMVASEFTYGVPAKVAIDFGLGLLSMSMVAIAIFMGVTLISRETENRTLYMVLSRPVERPVFLLGRLLGLAGILLVNTIILSFFILSLYLSLGGIISNIVITTIIFSYLEGIMVMLIVVLLSLIANNVLSVLMTMTSYVAGHAVEVLKETATVRHREWLSVGIDMYSKIMPNFSKLNMKQFVYYEDLVTPVYLGTSFFYAIIYCLFLMILSSVIFTRKELV